MNRTGLKIYLLSVAVMAFGLATLHLADVSANHRTDRRIVKDVTATVPVTTTTWAKRYGGSNYDSVSSVVPTADGGYVLAGYTNSFGSNDVDAWVIKLNAEGDVIWSKTYGGVRADTAFAILTTNDRGYIVAGSSGSFGTLYSNFWLFKLDESGNLIWQKMYNGLGNDFPSAIAATREGGYVVTGITGKTSETINYDFWVLKLDATGHVVWSKTYGDSNNQDAAAAIAVSGDGGYVIVGYTRFADLNLDKARVLKVDASGNEIWSKAFGGNGHDHASAIVATTDGNYIVAGFSTSAGPGVQNAWIFKLDEAGNVLWQQAYGGDNHVTAAGSIALTSDGGYIVAGSRLANGAGSDIWLAKLDVMGNLIWQKNFGGYGNDGAGAIALTADGGLVVAGATNPNLIGPLTDAWVLKLDTNGNIGARPCSVGNNPAFPSAITSTITISTPMQSATITATAPISTSGVMREIEISAADFCPSFEMHLPFISR